MPDYCSWVPTVGGRLSFSIIGDPQHNENASSINFVDNNIRHLVCYQQRELLDSSIPFLKKQLASLLFSIKGTFEFLLVAKALNDPTKKDATLEGVMCFFPTESEGWKNSKATIFECIDTLEKSIEDDFSTVYEEQLKDVLHPVIENNSFFFTEFKLTRGGIVNLNIPSNLSNNENIPSSFIDNKQEQRYAAAQLFFFLKDISHVHQHHHGRTDTIIDIHADDKDHTWRQLIIRSLYRKVLRFKRSTTEESCLSSLGVLSYLKAFVNVITNKRSDKSVMDEIEHLILDNENIEDSINISLDKIKSKNTRKTQFWNNLRTITISVLGLLLSIIGLASFIQPPIKIKTSNNLILDVTKFTVEQPLLSGGIVIILGFFILILTDDIPWKDWNWVNDLARTANTFPKRVGGILLIMIAALLMLLAISFI